MANFFLGFPVPRARIADMITGAAPPLEHTANHRPDGSDPLVLPGDISSGQLVKWNGSKFIGLDEPQAGITFPWNDYHFHTHFESLDGFDITANDNATVTLDHDQLLLTTDGSDYSFAAIKKEPTRPPIPLTWAKPRIFLTKVRFKLNAGVDAQYYVFIGNPYSTNAIGFRVASGVFRAYSVDVGGNEYHDVEDWSLSPATYDRLLAIVFDPPAYPKFYVDGSLVYTATSRKPTGTTNAERIFYANVGNPGGGHAQELSLSQFMFWQGA